jgi:hypothetical protein
MKTLPDAWNWYKTTKQNLTRMRRLGERYWSDPALEAASLWQDDHFRMLEAVDVEAETRVGLEPIDDLAIVVLFSVFESVVRDYLKERIKPEAGRITDPILKEAADDAIQGVEEGSFSRCVLDPLKKQDRVEAELVTQIDQVRGYRNWVAHGRREAPTNNVTPAIAYERLAKFLRVLGIAAESEEGDFVNKEPS